MSQFCQAWPLCRTTASSCPTINELIRTRQVDLGFVCTGAYIQGHQEVVAFSLGHGHWAYGSTDIVVDGKVLKGDPRRATGVHANAAMRVDPYLQNTCPVDPVGGSAVFYDTWIHLERA